MTKHDPADLPPQRPSPVAKPAPLPDPQAILADPTLTREAKIDKLRRWGHDAREVETANDEGMRGAVTPSNLPAVQAALRQLGAAENPVAEQEAADGS